ncbi:hypothetical protein [Mesorhizobium sp. M1348]|uniref:hypothetical protein n=1 Tax=Mesorhizobium sp. M1348 TaxID=2957089 RepID=UPI00333891AD
MVGSIWDQALEPSSCVRQKFVLQMGAANLMQYEVVEMRLGPDVSASDICYLVRNTWDDFGFKTLFEVVLFDENARRYDLASVRIMQAGMDGGYVELPLQFEALDERYCSIGRGREYYIELSSLPLPLRRGHLADLRDCVAAPAIFGTFRNEPAMRSSLLRDVSVTDVSHTFPASCAAMPASPRTDSGSIFPPRRAALEPNAPSLM